MRLQRAADLLRHLHSSKAFAEGPLHVRSYAEHLEVKQETAVTLRCHCLLLGTNSWNRLAGSSHAESSVAFCCGLWAEKCLGGLSSTPEQHTAIRYACLKGGVGQNAERESPHITNRKLQDINPQRPRNGASLALAFSLAAPGAFPFCLFV